MSKNGKSIPACGRHFEQRFSSGGPGHGMNSFSSGSGGTLLLEYPQGVSSLGSLFGAAARVLCGVVFDDADVDALGFVFGSVFGRALGEQSFVSLRADSCLLKMLPSFVHHSVQKR